MDTLGNIIKNKRLELGLSQVELSKLSGIDSKTISFIERDIRKKPIPETLLNLSEALDLKFVELCRISGYTDEEIEDMFGDLEETYPFNFTITIKGNAFIDAENITDAKDIAAKEISTEIINAANNNELLKEILHDSKLSILIEIKKDWYYEFRRNKGKS